MHAQAVEGTNCRAANHSDDPSRDLRLDHRFSDIMGHQKWSFQLDIERRIQRFRCEFQNCRGAAFSTGGIYKDVDGTEVFKRKRR